MKILPEDHWPKIPVGKPIYGHIITVVGQAYDQI
jgi:hypothetical protein